jgi:hypothetical protein
MFKILFSGDNGVQMFLNFNVHPCQFHSTLGTEWKTEGAARNFLKSLKRAKPATLKKWGISRYDIQKMSVKEVKDVPHVDIEDDLSSLDMPAAPTSDLGKDRLKPGTAWTTPFDALPVEESRHNAPLAEALMPIVSAFKDSSSLEEYLKKQEELVNYEDTVTIDILHKIELSDHIDPAAAVKYVDDIKSSRLRRRMAKDNANLAKILMDAGIQSITALSTELGHMDTRSYTVRIPDKKSADAEIPAETVAAKTVETVSSVQTSEKAKAIGHRFAGKVTVDPKTGIEYPTLSAYCNVYGVDIKRVSYFIHKRGMNLEEATNAAAALMRKVIA